MTDSRLKWINLGSEDWAVWPFGRWRVSLFTGLDYWTWNTGLTQTAIKCPFQCKTEAHSSCYFAKVTPLACWGIVSTVEAFFLKSVEVKGHMHILISIYLVQTCQVTLISRVRPTFWPVNQHLLLKIWISTDGVTSILESHSPYFALEGGAKEKTTLILFANLGIAMNSGLPLQKGLVRQSAEGCGRAILASLLV